MHKTLITAAFLLLAFSSQTKAADIVKDTLGFDSSYASSPSDLIQGRVSGVRSASLDGSLNGKSSTFIRGLNSLRGENEPLWIVDGTPLISNGTNFNSLAFLNPYDIESIQVVKNISEAAEFGAKGANGAIIITTKKIKEEGTSFVWRSNLGGSFSYLEGPEYRNAFVHNHSFLLSSVKGQSSLNISGRVKNDAGIISGTSNLFGGLRISFETKANPVVWFSVNTILSAGKMQDQTIAAEYGSPSLMMIDRRPDLYSSDTIAGWLNDYDNDANEMRMVTSADLTLNFTKSLKLKTTAGVDYRNFMGYNWYGKGTSIGLAKNGVAMIDTDALLRYNLNSVFSWNRYFGKHFVKAYASANLTGDWIRKDLMYGSDFFTHELRAKGLNLHADKTSLKNHSADYFNWNVTAGADWNYDGRFGASAFIKPTFTPRYGNSPILYFGTSAFAKPTDFLTLRAGYGKAGREQYVPDHPTAAKEIEYFYEGLNRGCSKEFNAGLDLTFFRGRLNISGGYYHKNTDDSFLSYCFGAKSSGNIWNWADRSDDFSITSSILSSGGELSIDATILEKAKTLWSVNTNMAYGKTKIDNLCEEDCVPKFYGGLGTTLGIGKFTFDVLTDFAAGYKIMNLSRMVFDSGVVPGNYLEDAGYFRLRRISAGYDFVMKAKSVVKGIKISLSIFNALTASPYNGYNPTVSNLGSDYGTYPESRSVVAGVSINF